MNDWTAWTHVLRSQWATHCLACMVMSACKHRSLQARAPAQKLLSTHPVLQCSHVPIHLSSDKSSTVAPANARISGHVNGPRSSVLGRTGETCCRVCRPRQGRSARCCQSGPGSRRRPPCRCRSPPRRRSTPTHCTAATHRCVNGAFLR